jgi:MoxR-like ATPase
MPRAGVVLKHEEVLTMAGVVRDVPIADHVEKFAARVLFATHPKTEQATRLVKQYVKYGASPRGLQAMILGGKVRALLDGRYHVSVEDIQQVARPALRHRVLLNFEGEAEEIPQDRIIEEILQQVTVEAG